MKITAIAAILALILFNNWDQVEIDPNLNGIEVNSTNWSYPWGIIKHEDHFENITGEPITEQDTVHILKNSQCKIRRKRDTVFLDADLPFANAEWKNDSLMISIFDYHGGLLKLKIVEGKFSSDWSVAYHFSYEERNVQILNQTLELNGVPKPGQAIKGKVNIALQEYIKWRPDPFEGRVDNQKLEISGTFIIN